jgi:tetratricopeptide (TPR) repeat protein
MKPRGLQVLNLLGLYDDVLEAVEKFVVRMRSLPERSDQMESVRPWNVRELILDAGRQAAMQSEKYELALELNAELIDVMKSRGAIDLDLALTSFNDHGPLLNLKRYHEAERLLLACKAVFEKERSVWGLGVVFSALADLMYEFGRKDQAVTFQETALRYKYLFGEPESISISHHNLATYLGEVGFQSALDHRLAAAVIYYKTGSCMLARSLGGLANDLDKFGPKALPGSFDQLVDRVEQLEGVRFKELCERLPKRAEDGDQLLKEIFEMARGANV